MTVKNPAILYIGSDIEFIKEIEGFALFKKHKLEIKVKDYVAGVFLETFSEDQTLIVYVDFTSLTSEIDQLVDEINFLKQYPPYRHVLFVALLADDDEEKSYGFLLSCGFQILFIKGTETNLMLKDCYYIKIGDEPINSEFATAKNIFRPVAVGMCSSLTQLNADGFLVESDYLVEDSQLPLKLNMFPDLKCDTFSCVARLDHSTLYPMSYSYQLEFPYAGPFDEFSEKQILKETVDTWLDFNREQLLPYQETIAVVTKDHHLVTQLYHARSGLPFHILITDDLASESFAVGVLGRKPNLIFVGLEKITEAEGEENQDMANLMTFIGPIKDTPYAPVLVLANSKTTSTAFQKVFEYSNILSLESELALNLITVFCKKYLDKKPLNSSVREPTFLKTTDPRRAVEVDFSVLLTSMSEHEITFFSDAEIPFFSNLHFGLPLPFYALTVPADKNLSLRENKFHYMAVIHGIGEDNLELFRQFINQIIFNPPKDFTKETIQSVFQSMTQPKVAVKENIPQEVGTPETVQEEPVKPHKGILRVIKGKSKL